MGKFHDSSKGTTTVFAVCIDSESKYNASFGIIVPCVETKPTNTLMKLPTFLRITRHQQDPWQRYDALKALRFGMQINNFENTTEMLHLIYYIKEAMEESMHNVLLASKYMKLKQELPVVMRKIIFAETLHIRNTYYNEYIYVSSSTISNLHTIFAWVPQVPVTQSNFYFNAFMDGDRLYFNVLNDIYDTGAKMCTHWEHYNNERRYTSMCVDSNDSTRYRWLIEPWGEWYRIHNWDGTSLYNPDGNHIIDNRRYIFTWLPGSLGNAANIFYDIS